jgi:CheY-like chemotaxis protein
VINSAGRILSKYSPQTAIALVMQAAQKLVPHDINKPCHPDASALAARVLVVEDHEIGREVMCLMLRRAGLSADKADNGVDAIEKIRRARDTDSCYALVLMDFSMPALGGIEATLQLRREGFDAAMLPIIAVTASADQADIAKFLDAGGQASLIKPITSRDLETAIGAWLPNRPALLDAPDGTPSDALFSRYEQRKAYTFAALRTFLLTPSPNEAHLQKILDLLHKLAGTAGAFGDQALSRTASACETAMLGATPLHAQQILQNDIKLMTYAK